MLNKIFKIKDSIDIYITDTEEVGKVLLTFHRITTRERTEILTNKYIAEFLALLDGKNSVRDILVKNFGHFDEAQALQLINYLYSERFIVEVQNKTEIDNRYKRQIAFFDDMFPKCSGEETQNYLSQNKIVLLGCGAVGSQLAEILLRMGILNFTLVDYKSITQSNLSRHLFARSNDIGTSKVTALKKYLLSINKLSKIKTINDKLLPTTNLKEWIDDDTSLIINTCDEPYIGHTSLKVGRYAHEQRIPIYIGGGFDAHLMSSGELINPPHTPCIDCIQKTFNLALQDWKPTYSNVVDVSQITDNTNFSSDNSNLYYIGGAGGLAMMSGFSAYLSALTIIRFLIEGKDYKYRTIRYEYLPNSGEMTEFQMNKQEHCNVCIQ